MNELLVGMGQRIASVRKSKEFGAGAVSRTFRVSHQTFPMQRLIRSPFGQKTS